MTSKASPRRHNSGSREPPHLLAGGRGGGPRHRRLAGRAADAVPGGRALPHAHVHVRHALGRVRAVPRQGQDRWPHALRQGT